MENSGEEIVADDKAAQSTYGIFHVCGVLAFCENTESIAKCSPLEKWKQRIPMEMTEARFRQTFEFLKEHHWIHDLHLTKFFESQVWTQIPKEWDRAFTQMTVEELNKLPFVEAAVGSPHSQSVSSSLHLPDSLQLFLQHSTSLTFERDHVTGLIKSTPVGKELAKGMSPKKLHEVQWMASLVHQVAAQADCDVVVDIGSGLGYLGQVLHTNYGLKVIGLEGSVGHTERAEKRAAKHGLQCSGMKSVPFEIRDDEEHITKFCDLIQREASTITQCKHSCPADLHMRSPDGGEGHSVSSCTDEVTITKERETDAVNHSLRVCLIGLHCCGDLTPALLRLFERVEFIRAVCCVSCCYHKMQLIPGTDQFHNFPMSKAAKDVYTAMQVKSQRTQEHAPTSFISPCSLRLAAQETRARWASQTVADHDVHMKHVAFRALLELYRGDTGSKDRRTVRRLDYSTVDQFVDSYVRCPEIPREEQQATKEQLYKLYAQVQPRFHHIEPFTCLQVILQPVLESLVLLDRQCWLQENGFHADIVPIFQEEISPRNLALVSTKSQN
ncbi:hypothetical protein BaRGS_00033406 [Batillaria attramentaria]|uniref:Methyltransferase domain-containing protein n=1 Tax=Batillaria attramentaria TaxID=370345 RepID=A0ABD0J9T8_9CAEN